jgi:hypothetical protein
MLLTGNALTAQRGGVEEDRGLGADELRMERMG